MAAEFRDDGTYTPDQLIVGETQIVTFQKTLESGENLTRGAVLGEVDATGKVNLSVAGAGDGSQTPWGILAQDCDASGGDAECIVYVQGEFNEDLLSFGAGHDADSVRENLRNRSCYIKKPA